VEIIRAMLAVYRKHAIETRVVAYPLDRPMNYPEHAAWVRERLPTEEFVLLAESFSGPVGVSIAAEPSCCRCNRRRAPTRCRSSSAASASRDAMQTRPASE
jgi:hypothetical protein